MRKAVLMITGFLLMLVCLTSCGTKEDPRHIGLNVEILEMNTELKGFVVKSLGTDSILGDKCYISCETPDISYIYVDFETEEVRTITYEDFEVGDEITVDVRTVENRCAATSRVQLITQRMT